MKIGSIEAPVEFSSQEETIKAPPCLEPPCTHTVEFEITGHVIIDDELVEEMEDVLVCLERKDEEVESLEEVFAKAGLNG